MFTASQAASYDAWRTSYPPEWDEQEARGEAIEDKAQELLEDECDPMTFENFVEFLAHDYQTDVIMKEFMSVVEANKQVMPKLIEALNAYWEAAAYRIAEHEFESGDLFDDGEP